MLTQRISRQGEKEEKNRQRNRQLSYFQALQPNFAIFLISLGTGHKVFTRGCGRFFLGGVGYEKTPEPLRGVRKKQQNL